MSRGGARSARRELQLNLSPPPAPAGMTEVDGHDKDGDSSTQSSCVSSDGGSPGDESSTMVIGACTRCLMYCMVAKKDYPTCINCKQPCLVDLLHGEGGGGVVVDAPDDKKRGKGK
jgi:hypothetical protein